MRKKKYKFTDKTHSRQGVLSSVLGLLSLLLLVFVSAAAYQKSGQAGKEIALLGFLALLLACVGLYQGVRSLKEEDSYPLFPWLGSGLNGILLIAFVLIYILGW
jgi:FtsH-binding integral membrane protein